MTVKLDKVGTTGSLKTGASSGPSFSDLSKKKQFKKTLPGTIEFDNYSRIWKKRRENSEQVSALMKEAKTKSRDIRFKLLKSASALKFCNETMLIKRSASGDKLLSTLSCGKKYCSICAGKKRRKLIRKYLDFFESEKGKEILDKYDLAMFTVTLKHNKETVRKDPYYKELGEHWRNGLKYGAFKKYFAGGFYNVEHTYTDNGHHIHRHALVLIPKEFKIYEGKRLEKSKTTNSAAIEQELQAQWFSRTGDSFQIDFSPFYPEQTVKENLLEVTKYITAKENGIINTNIILAIDENCREKFYHKFGILYKIKELNMNEINEEMSAENETLPEKKVDRMIKLLQDEKEPFELIICSRVTAKRKIYKETDPETAKETTNKKILFTSFKQETKTHLDKDLFTRFRDLVTNTQFLWRIEQMDRYDSNCFYDRWKEIKAFRERMDKQKSARNVKQAELFPTF